MIRRGRFYDIYRIEVNDSTPSQSVFDLLQCHFAKLEYIDWEEHVTRGKILVNGKVAQEGYSIKPGDTITALIDKTPGEFNITPEEIALDIVYEDDHLLVINKPAGMVVHPGTRNWSGTLANALIARYKELPCQGVEKDKPGIVHRIDKETSGLLVCAKDMKTMEGLSEQFYAHSIDRTYYALIWGVPKYSQGTIQAEVGRNPQNKRLRAVVPENRGGKYAITHYKVLEQYKYNALLQCHLETGRTHQIRVHLSHEGFPLFADKLYGGYRVVLGKENQAFTTKAKKLLKAMQRQALHAKSLGFTHPILKKRLFFESELPKDFQNVLEGVASFR